MDRGRKRERERVGKYGERKGLRGNEREGENEKEGKRESE